MVKVGPGMVGVDGVRPYPMRPSLMFSANRRIDRVGDVQTCGRLEPVATWAEVGTDPASPARTAAVTTIKLFFVIYILLWPTKR
jgi:hypothetical protein